MTRNLNFKEFGSGKQIIILHGLLGSLDNWVSIALKLSQNYKVTILDLPNHGRSYHSNTFSYYDMATSLNEFIKTRRKNFFILKNLLSDLSKYFILPKETRRSKPSWFGFPITIKKSSKI